MTGHGFRGMASTLLNEQGWHPDAIERRKMMQAWADYLDGLKAAEK